MGIAARAYANVADVVLVWSCDRIAGCLGFAVQRKDQSGGPAYLPTYMPFAPDPAAAPATPANPAAPAAPVVRSQPSDHWPIQRYIWADYGAQGLTAVQYQVVPVMGTPGSSQADLSQASPWTDPVACGTGTTAGFDMWFTRGIVGTPSVERSVQAIITSDTTAGQAAPSPRAVLHDEISNPASHLRQDLAGPVLPALRSLLADVKASGLDIYAALYELNDAELVQLLAGLGQSCHLLLGNGSYTPTNPDVNAAAAQTLQGQVDLSRRKLTSGALAHNKFVVVCQGTTPVSVWTGSTNWTITGLCTESNNALLIHDPAVAQSFLDYWNRLHAAGDAAGRTIAPANRDGSSAGSSPGSVPVPGGPAGLRAWQAALPVTSGKSPSDPSFTVDDLIDLGEAAQLIRAAEHGVLFLMFQPGPAPTSLIKPIEDLATAGKFVHGVINQPPTGDTTNATLTIFNRGAKSDDDLSVVMPEMLLQPVAGESPEHRYDNVMIHSKLIVVDPFGASPVVMTGSHNMGKKASTENDDNLVIITGAPGLAREYAVYIQVVFDAYKWRYQRAQRNTAGAASTWSGLARDDTWQDGSAGGPAYTDVARPQVQFWLDSGSPVQAGSPA
jgi:phosphatidylserine/phosphatidylglycerophosphate/cardiolipin synthase-like enzyme